MKKFVPSFRQTPSPSPLHTGDSLSKQELKQLESMQQTWQYGVGWVGRGGILIIQNKVMGGGGRGGRGQGANSLTIKWLGKGTGSL